MEFAPERKTKQTCNNTEACKKHCPGFYCEKGAGDKSGGDMLCIGLLLKEDFSVFITIALWKKIATGRRRLIQKLFLIEPAMFIKLLHRIKPKLAKQNT